MTQGASNNPLTDAVGYQLKRVDSLLRARMEEVLRPLGLSVPQYACLELLGQQAGLSNADLARGAFVSRQSMNLVLRGLQDRGLVERPASVDQGRARPSRLSSAGSALLARASAAIVVVERQMLAGLRDEERAALLRSLNVCAANLS